MCAIDKVELFLNNLYLFTYKINLSIMNKPSPLLEIKLMFRCFRTEVIITDQS